MHRTLKSKSVSPESVLPSEVEEALMLAVAPVLPPADRNAALRARLIERVGGGQPRFVTVRSADGRWQALLPNVAIKILHDDGAMQAFLLRLDPGAVLPAHNHTQDEMCVVLEGSVRLGDIEVSAGDYHFAHAGTLHGDVVSATGAVLFLRTGHAPPSA